MFEMVQDVIPIDELYEAAKEQYGYDIYIHHMANATMRAAVAMVSVISSSVLVWMLLRSSDRLSTPNHRILLGMSVSDILCSLSAANLNLTSPRDIDYTVWNARGNQITCSAQGLAWGVGMAASLFYSCSLNLYFLAVVRYNKTDEYIRARIEPFLHAVPIGFSLIVGIALLAKKNFNSSDGGICYVPVYRPLHCNGYDDGVIREGFDIPCGRGVDGVPLLSYTFFFILMVIVPLTVGISLGMIHRSVVQQENRMLRYGTNAITDSRPTEADGRANGSSWITRLRNSLRRCMEQSNSNSRAVLRKAFAYSMAYFLAWSFATVGFSLTAAKVEWPLFLWYLTTILNPLQGLFNVTIYLYPKVKSAKSRDENVTWRQAFSSVISLQQN